MKNTKIKYGKKFRVFNMKINGRYYYFVGRYGEKGFITIYKTYEQALQCFNFLEGVIK